ncbi:hypothetical protein K3495_g9287 [Podosphaera aphanis]|nr:hypothetical protein K3495_g9287 [Podosphaera aphanis]
MSAPDVALDRFFTNMCEKTLSRSMNLANIAPLDGQATYDSWAEALPYVWRYLGLYELVVEGQKPVPDADQEEIDSYKLLYHMAKGIYLQVVKPEIWEMIYDKDDPHLMWIHLSSTYRRDTASAFIFQLGAFSALRTAYDPSMTLASFINTFETELFKLSRFARNSSNAHHQLFATFFTSDTEKRNFLLAFLSDHQRSIVRDLTRENNLTYAQIRQRLINLDNERPVERPPFVPVANQQNRITKKKTCNYCKKHFPRNSSEHNWKKCPKLKEKRLEKSRATAHEDEEVHMTGLAIGVITADPL